MILAPAISPLATPDRRCCALRRPQCCRCLRHDADVALPLRDAAFAACRRLFTPCRHFHRFSAPRLFMMAAYAAAICRFDACSPPLHYVMFVYRLYAVSFDISRLFALMIRASLLRVHAICRLRYAMPLADTGSKTILLCCYAIDVKALSPSPYFTIDASALLRRLSPCH